MPSIISNSVNVVEVGGLTVQELVGNVTSTSDFVDRSDDLSIARVTVTKSNPNNKSEQDKNPWIKIAYDEYLCVLKGIIEIQYYSCDNSSDDVYAIKQKQAEQRSFLVKAGETCFVKKGEIFRTIYVAEDIEYIAVCIPAFQPQRCIELEMDEVVRNGPAAGLVLGEAAVNKKTGTIIKPNEQFVLSTSFDSTSNNNDIIYHMCLKEIWYNAVESGMVYYPPTFVIDGYFIHASRVPNHLIHTANHFYQSTAGEWVCIKLSIKALHNVGIITKYEIPKPVGIIQPDAKIIATEISYPHIYGGIPTAIHNSQTIALNIYPMQRNESTGEFLSIIGLTDI